MSYILTLQRALHWSKVLAGLCQQSGIPVVSQMAGASLKMLEGFEEHYHFSPRLLLTHDSGPDSVTLTRLEVLTAENDSLRKYGESLLATQDKLFMMLRDQVGDHRLLNGLAADSGTQERYHISPRLFFTHDNGPDSVTLTRLEVLTSENDPLRKYGESLLSTYNELLIALRGDEVGDRRLQNGLAAAVAGLNAEEFYGLPEETKADHRRKFVRTPIHERLAPNLIVYLGTPAPNQRMPAALGKIHFAHEAVESELYPWDPTWEDSSSSPTALGWTSHSMAPQSSFIFLSGVFMAWMTHWSQELRGDREQYRSTLLLHLKVTLYHELAHHLRNLVPQFIFSGDLDSLFYFQAHGVLHDDTPQKCIDHESNAKPHHQVKSKFVGEAGRLAEAMAFGAVIDLALSPEGYPLLTFYSLDQHTTYGIPVESIEQLFHSLQPSAPLNLIDLSTTKALSDSPFTRIEKALISTLTDYHARGKANSNPTHPSSLAHSSPIEHSSPTDSSPIERSSPTDSNPSTPTLPQKIIPFRITGKFLAKIEAERAHLDEIKSSCVARGQY